MTVEDLEIVITTNIQKAMPNIRKVVKEVKNAVNETKGLNADVFKGIDMKKVANDVSKATNTTIKETKKMKEQLKNLGLKDAGDTTGLKIQGLAREITGISNKFKELKGQRGVLGDVFEAQKFKQQAGKIKSITDKVKSSISNSGYRYDSKAIQSYVDNFKGGNIKKTVVQADTKKAEINVDKLNSKLNNMNGKKITANVKTNASSELNKSNSFANRLKNAMQQVKKQIDGSGNSTKKLSSGLSSAVGSVSKITTPLKMGLGQILKIAGALFSLRSIYSILSNSANAWLSSQNAQAQQLSANIDYMKYALGSALAPVIEWIVNLIYQALKGVQALIYALTGVNIFAKASAKSYAGMAGSAKKAKDETKQLAGIHNEINNIQDTQGSDSGGGGGATPNFDLGNLDGKFSAFAEKVKAILSKLFEPIKNAWDTYGQGLMESIKTSAIKIKELFVEVGKSFAEVWLNGTGEKTCGLILQILTSIFDIIGSIAESWKNAWANNSNGTQIVQHLSNAFNNILEIVLSVCNAFKEWWKTDQAQKFTNSIIGYFKIFSERVEKATEILKNLWEKGGKDAFTNLLNVIGKLAELWTALNEVVEPFVLTLMEELEPTLSLVVEWINKVLDALGGLLDFLVGIFTGDWERAWEGLGTYVGSAMQAVKTLLLALFEFIVELPLKIHKKLAEKLAEIAISLAKQIKGFFTQKIKEAGGNVTQGLLNGILEGLKNIGKWVSDNIVAPFVDGFKNAMGIHSPSIVMFELGQYVIEGLLNGINSLKEKVAEIWENIKSKAIETFTNVKQKIEEVWNNIKSGTEEKWTNIKSNIVNNWESIKTSATDKFNAIKNKVSQVWDNLKTSSNEKWNNIRTDIINKWNNIKSQAGEKFENIKDKISQTWRNIKNDYSLTDAINNIRNKFSGLGQNAISWGRDMMQGFKRGIDSMKYSLGESARSIASRVSSFLHFSRPDEGPLREYETWMPDMIEGLSKTLTASAPKLYGSTRNLASKLADEFNMSNILNNMKYTINRPDISPISLDNVSTIDFKTTNIYSSMLDILSDLNSNNDRPIGINLSVNVGNEKLGQILLNDLRNMKRASGKDIEALVGG